MVPWIMVNMGSGYGLLPDGIETLPASVDQSSVRSCCVHGKQVAIEMIDINQIIKHHISTTHPRAYDLTHCPLGD